MSGEFLKDNNYNIESGISRVKFGTNKPLLEVELNEVQKIQEELQAALVNKVIPSGFLNKKLFDFNEDQVVLNPNSTPNSFAIAPCDLIIAGHKVRLQGKYTIDNYSYELIKLGEPPTIYDELKPSNFDFVFLEAWFQEIGEHSNIYSYGNIGGEILSNSPSHFDFPNTHPIVDPRVGMETSRRVALMYRVRVEKNIFFQVPENIFEINNIYAQGSLIVTPNEDKKRFMFKRSENHYEKGIFVAKSEEKKDINLELSVLNSVVYAVPMFMVRRRVEKDYDEKNINHLIHAPRKHPEKISYRFDEAYCDFLLPTDVIDVRKMISFQYPKNNKILDDVFLSLILGRGNSIVEQKKMLTNGINNTYSNREHVEDIVQVVDVKGSDTYFLLSDNFSSAQETDQAILYDIFNLRFENSDISSNQVKLYFSIPSYFPSNSSINIEFLNAQVWQKARTNQTIKKSTTNIVALGLSSNTNYIFRLILQKKNGEKYYSKKINLTTT
jgi:hypothetical protein